MKIRAGYVSNRSSTSFLVIFRDRNEFGRFKDFRGYGTFMNDLDKGNQGRIEDFIKSCETLYFLALTDCHDETDSIGISSPWDLLEIACDRTGIEFSGELLNASQIVERILRRKLELKNEESKWEASEHLRNEFRKEFNGIADMIALEIKRVFEQSGLNHRILEYEDHTDIGGYMEHQFMPFLAKSPDDDFVVIALDNH